MKIDNVKDIFENDNMVISLMNKDVNGCKFSTLDVGEKDSFGDVISFETVYCFKDLIKL